MGGIKRTGTGRRQEAYQAVHRAFGGFRIWSEYRRVGDAIEMISDTAHAVDHLLQLHVHLPSGEFYIEGHAAILRPAMGRGRGIESKKGDPSFLLCVASPLASSCVLIPSTSIVICALRPCSLSASMKRIHTRRSYPHPSDLSSQPHCLFVLTPALSADAFRSSRDAGSFITSELYMYIFK